MTDAPGTRNRPTPPIAEPALIAVAGATGQQGGAVVDALLDRGHRVRALTRNPDGERAVALRARGVEVVQADPADPVSLERAFAGVDAAYGMTTLPADGDPATETAQGVAIVDAAKAAGLQHLVFASVGGAERDTGIPHFDSKYAVERHLASSGLNATVLRPVFFMENLLGTELHDGTLTVALPVPDDIGLQLIATADIGRVAAAVMLDPDWYGRSLEIAGDERTGSQLAEAFAEATGRPARYQPLGLEVLGGNADMTAMFSWFAGPVAYQADLATTRRLDPDLLDVPGWLRSIDWQPKG